MKTWFCTEKLLLATVMQNLLKRNGERQRLFEGSSPASGACPVPIHGYVVESDLPPEIISQYAEAVADAFPQTAAKYRWLVTPAPAL